MRYHWKGFILLYYFMMDLHVLQKLGNWRIFVFAFKLTKWICSWFMNMCKYSFPSLSRYVITDRSKNIAVESSDDENAPRISLQEMLEDFHLHGDDDEMGGGGGEGEGGEASGMQWDGARFLNSLFAWKLCSWWNITGLLLQRAHKVTTIIHTPPIFSDKFIVNWWYLGITLRPLVVIYKLT